MESARKRPIPYHRPSPSSSSSVSGRSLSRSWSRSQSRSPSCARRIIRASPSPKKKPVERYRKSGTKSPNIKKPSPPRVIYRLESPRLNKERWTPPPILEPPQQILQIMEKEPTPIEELPEQLMEEQTEYYATQAVNNVTVQTSSLSMKEKVNLAALQRSAVQHVRPPPHHIHPSLALLHHARPHSGLSLVHEPILIHDPYHPLLRTPLQRHIPGSYYSPYLGAPYC